MIQDRELALKLANKWGSKKDVNFLLACLKAGKISEEDKRKVLKFWDKKFRDAETLFWQGRVTLGFIKDDYSKAKLLQKHFGGRIIEEE